MSKLLRKVVLTVQLLSKLELFDYLKGKMRDLSKVSRETRQRSLGSASAQPQQQQQQQQQGSTAALTKNVESLTHQALIVLRTFYTLVRNLGSSVFERIADAD